MELSLDEIIKKNKISTGSNGSGSGITKKFAQNKDPLRKTLHRPGVREMRPDARLKIVQKNRSKIRDAREKLMEVTKIKGDARRLIENRRTNGSAIPPRNGAPPSFRNGLPANFRNGRLGLTTRKNIEPKPIDNFRRSRQPEMIDIPRGYVDYDNMERMEEEEYAAARGLSRTVQNNLGRRMDTYSPPRNNSIGPEISRRRNSDYDPFEVYIVSNDRKERHMSPTELPPPPKGILRSSTRQHSPDMYQRRYIPENSSHLSYEMRSRLETIPDPHASMGIFSNPLRVQSNAIHISPNGYRIVVSNLHPSVTQSDIKELFEDVGELYDSRIVRPGVAEVIYKSLNDAEKAVDTYHNRQLDRQPMKCLLVNPRASDKPTAPAIKTSSSSSRLSSGKTPLEIDIDALHKVLFRRH